MLKALHEKDASAGLKAAGDALANHVEMKLFMRLPPGTCTGSDATT
ncbi:MAG: hypothetical protein R3B69_04520 [Candidatus Paceibacterota bacterium]